VLMLPDIDGHSTEAERNHRCHGHNQTTRPSPTPPPLRVWHLHSRPESPAHWHRRSWHHLTNKCRHTRQAWALVTIVLLSTTASSLQQPCLTPAQPAAQH
jgi:hypothetical protein